VNLLIPGSDSELLPLSESLPRLKEQGIMVAVSDPSCVRLCRDKLALATFLRSKGLPFVRTFGIRDALSTPEILTFPLVLKEKGGSGSVGTRIVFSLKELAQHAEILQNGTWIVQPFLMPATWINQPQALADAMRKMRATQKPVQREEVSVQFFLDAAGMTLGSYASLNILKDGVPMVADPINDAAIWKAAESIVAELVPLGLRGPVNLQGRLTTEGPLFFEMNARFTGITHVRTLMGYKEVEAAVLLFGMGAPPDRVAQILRPMDGAIGVRQMSETIVLRKTVEELAKKKRIGINRSSEERILVTGSTGYLGLSLMETLLSRDSRLKIVAAVRSPERAYDAWKGKPHADRIVAVNWSQGDPLPVTSDISTIIHAAAERPSPEASTNNLFFSNVQGTIAAVDAARRMCIPKFIFLSSQIVYGTGRPCPWREDMELQPENPYGYSKAASEALVQTLSGGLTSWVILRLARLYGRTPGMRMFEFPHLFAERAVRGSSLTVFGDGSQEMDLLHVRDAAEAVYSVFIAPVESWNTIYNAGSGRPISVKDFATLCVDRSAALTGRRSVLEQRPLTGPAPSFGMDINRIKTRIGWEPKIDIIQGMDDLISGFLDDVHYEPEKNANRSNL
jgi:nucleoside-diphosphate-sugar epimerase